MKGILIGAFAIACASAANAQPPTSQPPPPQQPRAPSNDTATTQRTMREIEQAFGFVPQFFRAISPQMLESFWSGMKFQSSARTALDPRTKELIGLAVAAQIPCEYCVHFHREAARAHGATDAELAEAVGMASVTRMGSTLLNGLDIDKTQFRRDVDRAMRNLRQQAQRTPTTPSRSRSKP